MFCMSCRFISGDLLPWSVFFLQNMFQFSGPEVLQSSEVEDALGLKAIADLMVEVDSNLVMTLLRFSGWLLGDYIK